MKLHVDWSRTLRALLLQYTKGSGASDDITGGAETVAEQGYLSHLDPEGLPGGLAVDLVEHGGELAPRTALVHAGHELGLGVLAEDVAHALLPLDGRADLFGEILLDVLAIDVDLHR